MESVNLPKLNELEAIRHGLIRQLEEARILFSAEKSRHVLHTGAAALLCIDELIQGRKSIKGASPAKGSKPVKGAKPIPGRKSIDVA